MSDSTPNHHVTRRGFLAASAGTTVLLPSAALAGPPADSKERPYQALGTRVGEVTGNAAIVWTRLTKHPQRNNEGVVFPKKADRTKNKPTTVPVEQIEGACPGMAGRVRLRYGLSKDLQDAVITDWIDVTEKTDFIHQFKLSGLKPGSAYHYASETALPGGDQPRGAFRGKFFTAPDAAAPSNFRFCVMTCQGYPDRDHVDGHPIYPSMLALEPKFVTMTGDLVYYDNNAPRAVTPALARLHWERMFSLPRLVAMMSNASSYWLKDDHDTLRNDSWPGMKAGELSWDEGLEIFRQQAPIGPRPYRTFRWGRDLQILVCRRPRLPLAQ